MNRKSAVAQAVEAEYGNLISFVPAGRNNVITKHRDSDKRDVINISGEEAKTFYENLLNESTNCTAKSKRYTRIRKKRKTASERIVIEKQDLKPNVISSHDSKSEYRSKKISQSVQEESSKSDLECRQNVNKLLYYSQTGDLTTLKKLLKQSPHIDINHQDGFGWTALMCATVSGHVDVVEYLLKNGASKLILNSQNQKASDLAESVGFHSLKDRLKCFLVRNDDEEDGEKTDPFFCEKCNTSFNETSLKEHQTSTLHLFNMNLKPKIDQFMIPKSNIGYRLMKQSGWDGEKGLGPEGKGQRLPVKTVLKRDRSCIGSKSIKKEKKITHFGPYDTNATRSVPRGSRRIVSAATVSRRERRKREKREKEWERNLRQSMDF